MSGVNLAHPDMEFAALSYLYVQGWWEVKLLPLGSDVEDAGFVVVFVEREPFHGYFAKGVFVRLVNPVMDDGMCLADELAMVVQ
jgi:hypothetical protein